jgi:hypothetical protein
MFCIKYYYYVLDCICNEYFLLVDFIRFYISYELTVLSARMRPLSRCPVQLNFLCDLVYDALLSNRSFLNKNKIVHFNIINFFCKRYRSNDVIARGAQLIRTSSNENFGIYYWQLLYLLKSLTRGNLYDLLIN